MNVVIIGGGAIGLLAAFYLRKQGHVVTVVTRTSEQREKLLQEGLCLEKQGQSFNLDINASTFQKDDYINGDVWIIALKQTQLDDFFKKWEKYSNLPPMLFLQNGMGHLEQASSLFTSPIYGGVVTHGAMKLNDRTIKHTGLGKIFLGSWKGITNFDLELATLVSHSTKEFPIIKTDSVEYMLKRKLLINLIVNPLTALYGVKNGCLLSNDEWIDNMRGLFKEGIEVLGLCESEWETVLDVVENTSENESSMLRDLKQGNKTEIHAITGYIIKESFEKNISVPITNFVHRSIVGLEGGR
ncbi:2-dehydropantoate 2-reductase [Evansella vedderi]|uniref:2-dehydropantoate 2-reductase n=1 Tax=Evansella vedderi TaxID=38282 RepID=A0ABT9ZRG4_9BACI|nr:2-dehydropantoate 2-reductase [Evansella vedderi]MDQ0253829.1 2-dehydropantoate 2-reductase [Evansella vedderi]